jgi:hypothetical protein
MLMPETAMNKDNLAQPRKNHVRRSGKIAYMKPVTESHAMNKTANDHFRASIRPLDTGHTLTSLLLGEIIHEAGLS